MLLLTTSIHVYGNMTNIDIGSSYNQNSSKNAPMNQHLHCMPTLYIQLYTGLQITLLVTYGGYGNVTVY